jgi:cytochrome c oxidase subunit 2
MSTRTRAWSLSAAVASGLLLGGCEGAQSSLNPAGPQAEAIARLWWVFLGIATAVVVLVAVALLTAVFRGRRRPKVEPTDGPLGLPVTEPDPAGERRRWLVVGTAVGATVVVLFALLVTDFLTGRAIRTLLAPDPLTVTITGNQWWWDVQYEHDVPAQRVRTANEIHVPTGRPVRFRLRSNDVVHSFWVPALHGKKDLIPGHPTETWFQADREGLYHGQCAEYCGHQHAHMRLVVVAESPAAFEAWYAAQQRPAPPPATPLERRGQAVFLASTCVMCHAVAGTDARGRVGPDLTHVAGRTHLGAGSIPNSRGHLAGWVSDPGGVKPGVRMPPNPFSPGDLQALLAYLASLQ